MDIRKFTIIAATLAIPAACSHDRRDSETPDQMTPASDYSPDRPYQEPHQPHPSTTNQPGQTGSPEPMNSPPHPGDAPNPNNTTNQYPGVSPSGARLEGAGGTAGNGGAMGSGGSGAMGASGGTAGRSMNR